MAVWKKNYKLWMKNKYLSENIKNSIKKYTSDELEEAFAYDLEFSTAGLHAKVGYGSAFFNVINVRRAAMAFAEFLQTRFTKKMLQINGVLIGHDNHYLSEKFVLEIISVFNSYNIKSIIFNNNQAVPTPIISYVIKKINAISGIAITAAHNSKEYNGLIIFDENGCQYLLQDTDFITEIYNSNTSEAIKFVSGRINSHFVQNVSNKIIDKYIADVLKIQHLKDKKHSIKIIFSNLHGTTQNITPKILKQAGYDVTCVKEQFNLDPDFLTSKVPNPELAENFNLAYKYAKEINADLVILNSPDADKIGVSVLHNNKYYILTSNELAPIFMIYLFEQEKLTNKKLPKNAIFYSSVVSSNLPDLIANSYNVKIKKTLSGCKWMYNQIIKDSNKKCLFAFEESNCFIFSDICKEKDAIQSSLIISEVVDFYKKKGKSLLDVLKIIYKKFGYFYCKTINKYYSAQNQENHVSKIMDTLRYKKIDVLGDLKIVEKEDYINSLYDMPSQNLIKFYFENGSWLAIQPSNNAPKIKFYFIFISNEKMSIAKKQMNDVKEDLFNNYLNI